MKRTIVYLHGFGSSGQSQSDSRYAETANKINGRLLLIIDNPLEKDQSIAQAYTVIMESYAPESITVVFTSRG